MAEQTQQIGVVVEVGMGDRDGKQSSENLITLLCSKELVKTSEHVAAAVEEDSTSCHSCSLPTSC